MTSAGVGVPRVRSALFVPASRPEFLAKAAARGADAVIVDLEDGVAGSAREEARTAAGAWLRGLDAGGPVGCVRVNGLAAGCLEADLAAVVGAGLTAVLVPKLRGAAEVVEAAEALAYYEGRAGLVRGSVRIWPIVETAEAVVAAGEIARASERVAYMGGGTSRHGDLAHSLGYRWTAEGWETLYVRAKVLVDVRAAGVPNPVTGLVSVLDDPRAVEGFAAQSRGLGYEGMMCIHPSQVAVANAAFSPTDDELREARAVLDALADADRQGQAVTTLDGQMIDPAMGATAKLLLSRAGDNQDTGGR
jgi:citrate lyase subunit beta/citryl-CoA lyase